MNKNGVPQKMIKKSMDVQGLQDDKIKFFEERIKLFFDEVNSKIKVNMIMKFAKIKFPKINLVEQMNQPSMSENQNFYEYEDEVDLINMEIPKPNP